MHKYRDRSSLTDIQADIAETPPSSRVIAMARVAAAKREFSKRAPDFVHLFDFFIHTMFYQRAHHSGGGSVSSALGVIWCSINKRWTDDDVVEFLVHEFTHNMLFLDERANEHYETVAAISDQRNWATSAILERARPLDKVFHSLLVATEVLKHREVYGEPADPHLHPPSFHLRRAASTKDVMCRYWGLKSYGFLV